MYLSSSKNNLIGLSGVILLHVLCYAFFPIYFNTNDDVAMAFIANGYFTGAPSQYLIFINVILGYVLKWGYELFPSVEWYSLLLVGVQFLSLTTLTILFQKRLSLVGKMAFWCAAAYFVVFLQFTHVAFLSALAGIILIHTRSQTTSNWKIAIGIMYLLFSFLIRMDMTIITLFIAIPFLWNFSRRRIIIFGIFGLLAALSFGINHLAYQSQEWQYFKNYNKVRGALHDNPNMRLFNDDLTAASKVGLTQEEIAIFNNMTPVKSMDLKKLEEIYEMVARPQSIGHFGKNLFQNYTAILLFLSILIIGFYKRSQFNKVKLSLGLFTLITVLICINHFPKDRITFSLLFLIFIFAHITSRGYNLKVLQWASVLVIVHFVGNLSLFLMKNNSSFEFKSPTENNVVALYSNYRTYFGRVKPFDMPSNHDNKIMASSWLVNSPIQFDQYRQLSFSPQAHFSPIDQSEIQKELLFLGDSTKASREFIENTVNVYLKSQNKKAVLHKQDGAFQYYKIVKE